MRPAEFEYQLVSNVDEAVSALAAEGVALAGGQSLIPLMRLGLAQPVKVVDIGRLPGVDGIQSSDSAMEIGALTTIADLAMSEQLRQACPVWSDAAEAIADPLVRNMGTVGGNIAHADPLNDLPAVVTATRTTVTAVGPSGERTVEADELFESPFVTSISTDELITALVTPKSKAGAYEKLKRAAADYGVVGVAVQLDTDREGRIERAGIGVTGTSIVGWRASYAEEMATAGSSPAEVAEAVAGDAELVADERGSVRYKRAVINALTRRAIDKALARGTS